MTFDVLVNNLIDNTLKISVPKYGPELVLCGTIVLLLLSRLIPLLRMISPTILAFAGTLVAFWLALPSGGLAGFSKIESEELFTGMLVYDSVTVYVRLFLIVFVLLFIILTKITGLADREDSQDLFTLVLGATVGMSVMVSANHLITIFLGVEMASVPSYVLVGVIKGRRRASEASLKYVVYGAGAAGVMLYGISLIAGILGTAHLPTMGQQLVALDVSTAGSGKLMVLALSGLMIMVGLAFKLSAVPFHFWCPDVFEGASSEVNAFLSVASKAAAFLLLVRITVGLGILPVAEHSNETESAIASAVDAPNQKDQLKKGSTPAIQQVSTQKKTTLPASDEKSHGEITAADKLAPVRDYMMRLIGILAAVTCTFGNLAAFGQKNIKRMLAYSTIAHAGYMMMAVAAMIASVGKASGPGEALGSLLLYLSLYLFMNLGAFAVIAFLRNAMHSEEIADYAGLIRSCPVTTIAMVFLLISLIGLPPFAGFVGKFFIFSALWNSGSSLMVFLLVVGGLNSVISLIYYLRVAKVMCIDPEPDTRGPVNLGIIPVCYSVAMALPVLVLGILPEGVYSTALTAAKQLFM